jgi:hypothetical protein
VDVGDSTSEFQSLSAQLLINLLVCTTFLAVVIFVREMLLIMSLTFTPSAWRRHAARRPSDENATLAIDPSRKLYYASLVYTA